MEKLDIFSESFRKSVEAGVKNISLETSEVIPCENREEKQWESGNSSSMSCSYCRVNFEDISTQRGHYKLDWHRFNLKQSLQHRAPISEREFEIRNENDDISSISGSESEQEGLDATVNLNSHGRIFLKTELGQVISIYKCVLLNKKDELSDPLINERLDSCLKNNQSAVLLLGGGHFAGAIFNETTPILHKTFHCYTVRQGQGGSQKTRDAKGGGSQPKSAGASLRRYNEQALVQHVQGILEQWSKELEKCGTIYFRASGPHNKSVLFDRGPKILDKSDARLRIVPFSTRRATFKEVQRVHSLLCNVQFYENVTGVISDIDKFKVPKDVAKRSKFRSSQINRAKSRELPQRPLPTKHSSETNSLAESTSNEEDFGVNNLVINDEELSFEHLSEYSSTKVPKKCKRRSRVKRKADKKANEKAELNDILTRGDLNRFVEIYETIGEDKDEFINQIMDENDNTILHLAAMNEHCVFLEFLLENNADPCRRNKQLQTPYASTQSKSMRQTMRSFAKKNPLKHNYNKAQIPTSSLTEAELEERKKLLKIQKREKDKIKRSERKQKLVEEEEKQRFLKLSDREKCALAAEKRILTQGSSTLARCFQCATDITGYTTARKTTKRVPYSHSLHMTNCCSAINSTNCFSSCSMFNE